MEIANVFENVSKEKFRSAANKLLGECFVLKRHKDTVSDYNYILNNISPLTGDSVKLKFRMNIASGTDIDYKFNACGNLANPHYKIQIGSAGGTPYSQVIYGENAGGAGEVKLYKSNSNL